MNKMRNFLRALVLVVVVLCTSSHVFGKGKLQARMKLEQGLEAEESLFTKFPGLAYIYSNRAEGQSLLDALVRFEKIIDTCIDTFTKKGESYAAKIKALREMKREGIKGFRLILEQCPGILEYENDLKAIRDLRMNFKVEQGIDEVQKRIDKYSSRSANDLNLELAYLLALQDNLGDCINCLDKLALSNLKVNELIDLLTSPYFMTVRMRYEVGWQNFEKKVIEAIEKSGTVKNLSLANTLWKIQMKDQWVRMYIELTETYENKEIKSITLVSFLYPLMRQIDKEHTEMIRRIMEENISDIDQDVIGVKTITSVFCVIQHSGDVELMKSFLPILEKECEKSGGWQKYMCMYDRLKLMENQKQVYGTQVDYDDSAGEYVLSPLEDEENVNLLRYEKGVYYPVQAYLAIFNKTKNNA